MNASEIKAIALNHIRFSTNHTVLATEMTISFGYRWDICSVKNGKVYEYEVKCNFYDLQNDFLKRNRWSEKKHDTYKNASINYAGVTVPNYMIFILDEKLRAKEKEIVKLVPLKYGICYAILKDKKYVELTPTLEFIRRPRLLHNQNISKDVEDQIFTRMSGDLVATYAKCYLEKLVKRSVENATNKI
ncbi:MAG: hypothetical protein PHX21_13570 [bacterium]|nr:hypothetical protein [bacterium]